MKDFGKMLRSTGISGHGSSLDIKLKKVAAMCDRFKCKEIIPTIKIID